MCIFFEGVESDTSKDNACFKNKENIIFGYKCKMNI